MRRLSPLEPTPPTVSIRARWLRPSVRGSRCAATRPRSLDELDGLPPLVITVCDQAHEELDPPDDWLHWSISDPVPSGSARAFDDAVGELRDRMSGLLDTTNAR